MPEVVWGLNPVLEALKNQPHQIESIWLAKKTLKGRRFQVLEKARKYGIPVKILAEFHPPKVPPEARTQGVVAYLKSFDYWSWSEFEEGLKPEEAPLLLFLDQLTDPQNVGALIRSAAALGAQGVVLPKHRSAPLTPAALKASAGAAFLLPIVRVVNLKRPLERLKDLGFKVFGLDLEGETPLFETSFKGPTALVVGSEGRGLRESVKRLCDQRVYIPMAGGVESLNAAVAGAIALYEALRQRSV